MYDMGEQVVERTQENWDYPFLDRVNDTVVDYKEGEIYWVSYHPFNAAMSILQPGRFARFNVSTKKHFLEGELVTEIPVSKLTSAERAGALCLGV